MSQPPSLLTVTWAGDRTHFRLLRTSIRCSALKSLRHRVAVHTEDLPAFQSGADDTIELIATADILPAEVEAMRRTARRWQARAGRHATRLLGSLARRTRWPRWVHYTGWHVQQITKLALAAAGDGDQVMVLDSDVVVTRHARPDDFAYSGKIVCLRHPAPAAEAGRKVRHWNRQAYRLFKRRPADDRHMDIYFDTPFVFHAPTVRAMLAWLERHYGKPWWRVLLDQPPRRWSEFASYRTYLRLYMDPDNIHWQSDRFVRYLFDASEPAAVRSRFIELLRDPDSRYITIHSQSSGRQLWGAEGYVPLILPLLEDG